MRCSRARYNCGVKKREGKRPPHGGHVPDPGRRRRIRPRWLTSCRFRRDPRGRIRKPPPIAEPRPATASADDSDDPDTDFAAPGVDRREVKKLKRGEFAVEGELDLHGRTADEACASVRRFIAGSRQRGHRCVCIVHGRGLHSDGNVSILKPRVRECLRTSPWVLAYANAPQSHGGAGAVHVCCGR
jgi:DNA-nicking Smr family endonuclease